MVNGVDIPVIFEHKDLVFQVPCFVKVYLWWVLGAACLRDVEGFAAGRHLTVSAIVQGNVRECGSKAD